jgi:hypothetical protein
MGELLRGNFPEHHEEEPKTSLRSVFEAQERKNRDGSFAESTTALLRSLAAAADAGKTREVGQQIRQFEPALAQVLKTFEDRDAFAEAVTHLKRNREIYMLRAVVGRLLGHEDEFSRWSEEVAEIDREFDSVANVLPPDKAK